MLALYWPSSSLLDNLKFEGSLTGAATEHKASAIDRKAEDWTTCMMMVMMVVWVKELSCCLEGSKIGDDGVGDCVVDCGVDASLNGIFIAV